MIRITIYAGHAESDGAFGVEPRASSVSVRYAEDQDVHEELRQIGLEWKTADYMTERQVVITLDPIPQDTRSTDVRLKIREAADALERTGLL